MRVPSADIVDRVSAEVWAAGAAGLEERSDGDETLLLVYATRSAISAVARAARAAAGTDGTVGPSHPVEDQDWRELWKEGLKPIVVSERLVVRPSFVPAPCVSGQKEIVIDPGRAFGTGGHASTLLALQWLDALRSELGPETRVLDVGAGTGVLALAALRFGAGQAVAFDIDPVATREARVCAERNGLWEGLRLFTGPVQALAPVRFDFILVNLLRRELLPLAAELAARTRPKGHLILSGLLEDERAEVEHRMSAAGFSVQGIRSLRDTTGDDWIGLLMDR